MSVARHRFGPQFVVHVAVASETAIRAGDALYLHEGEARPASSFTWDDNLAATRASFNDQFLGIALADHPADSGDESLFPVDISPLAVYEMDCVVEPHEVGATLGPRQGDGETLDPSTLEVAAAAGSSDFKPIALHKPTVYVRMQSAYWGVNDAARQ